MNAVLWVLQILLAIAFFAHGWIFLFPPADMVAMMNATLSPASRYFIGIAEVLAAVGLILPGLTRILPELVAAAAGGVMVIMIAATIFHVTRGEGSSALTTAFLGVVAAFVAYTRWKVRPILRRPATVG